MAEGQDNFRDRFLSRILSEGSPVGTNSPSLTLAWLLLLWLGLQRTALSPGRTWQWLLPALLQYKNTRPSTRDIAKALSSSL